MGTRLYVEPPTIRPPWRELSEPDVKAALAAVGSEFVKVIVRTVENDFYLRAIRSLDAGLWHLSISHALRYPTWAEMWVYIERKKQS